MKSKFTFVFLALLAFINVNAQTNDECKYLQVLTYLKYNYQFNTELKANLDLNKKEKKSKFVDLKISPWIALLNITRFKDEVNADRVGLDKKIISDESVSFHRYNFETYKSELLEKLGLNSTDARLYLTFSKVIGKTLLVEILNNNNHPHAIRHLGQGVDIMIIFDDFGVITKALIKRVYYN